MRSQYEFMYTQTVGIHSFFRIERERIVLCENSYLDHVERLQCRNEVFGFDGGRAGNVVDGNIFALAVVLG